MQPWYKHFPFFIFCTQFSSVYFSSRALKSLKPSMWYRPCGSSSETNLAWCACWFRVMHLCVSVRNTMKYELKFVRIRRTYCAMPIFWSLLYFVFYCHWNESSIKVLKRKFISVSLKYKFSFDVPSILLLSKVLEWENTSSALL